MVTLGAALGASLAMAVPVVIAETNIRYCGFNTEPKTRCWAETDRHSYNTNVATGRGVNNGNQYLAKCERMTYWSDYNSIYSRRCNSAIQTVGRWDDYCGNCQQHENTGVLLKVYVGNDDPYQTQMMWGSANY